MVGCCSPPGSRRNGGTEGGRAALCRALPPLEQVITPSPAVWGTRREFAGGGVGGIPGLRWAGRGSQAGKFLPCALTR